MNRQEIETKLGLELPNDYDKYDLDTQELIIKYLTQLTPIEKKAYSIGKVHLKSSFNVVKSNGFIDWVKSNK